MKPLLANSYRQMENLLEQKRPDLLLVYNIEGLSPTNDSEWSDLVILSDPVNRFPLYHYLHRHHSKLAIHLAQALRELDLSGEKAWLIEKARAKLGL